MKTYSCKHKNTTFSTKLSTFCRKNVDNSVDNPVFSCTKRIFSIRRILSKKAVF